MGRASRHAQLPLFQTGRRDMTSRLLQPRDMYTCKIFFFSWSDAKNSGVELKRLVLNFLLRVPVKLRVSAICTEGLGQSLIVV